MVDVTLLRRQHDSINDVILELKGSTKTVNDIETSAQKVANKISQLAGVLSIHLGSEDKHLYPHLMQNGSDELKKIAQDYVLEMGNISNEFVDYKNRFNTKSKIIKDTDGFVSETKRILTILEDRIEKEETALYRIL